MQTVNSRVKTSPVWAYFVVVNEDPSKAKCVLCSAVVSRGGSSAKGFTTTIMRRHVEQRHQTQFKEMQAHDEASKKESPATNKRPQQQTLPNALAKQGFYSPDHPRHKLMTAKLMNLICQESLPFSIVESESFREYSQSADPRFKLPSRKHVSTVELDRVYSDYEQQTQLIVDEVTKAEKSLAMTCDVWTSRPSDSYQSLTMHFLDEHFERRCLILDTALLTEKHTGAHILNTVKDSLAKWKIKKEHIIAFVRDSGRNMVSAFNLEKLPALSCVDHVLQLAIQDGLEASEYIQSVLKHCRRLVGHFKHSPSAYRLLKECQKDQQVKELKLVQECSTRWNSTLQMLQRLVKLRQVIIAVLPETTCDVDLDDDDWLHMEQLIKMLEPIQELSLNLEGSTASIGQVIPGLRMITKRFEKPCDNEKADVESVREGIRDSLNLRFKDAETNDLYSIGTVLDPRFKVKGFSSNFKASVAKQKIQAKLETLPAATTQESSQAKRQKPNEGSIWEDFLDDDDDVPNASVSATGSELQVYLSLPRCELNEDIYKWWAKNAHQFPKLSVIVRQVLCVPPTSADSERLFSTTGNIVTPSRNCLNPDKVKKLAFVKKNKAVLADMKLSKELKK